MLKTLYIRNYALIDELNLRFDDGLSVITGETGAGKSIILGALELILGQRARQDSLGNTDQKCIIEGVFRIKGYHLEHVFEENDIDYSDESIFRREILASGKSRSFINDTPVSLQLMKFLGEQLVDIHSQNRTITLNEADVQLALLDQYAGNADLLEKYQQAYHSLSAIQAKLQEAEEAERQFREERDYLQYLYDELEQFSPKQDELEEIESELDRLNHAELILESLHYAADGLVDGDVNITDLLGDINTRLKEAGKYFSPAKLLAERAESSLIELKDIADEVGALSEDVEANPERSRLLGERLDDLNRLLKKHNADSDKELIDKMKELDHALEQGSSREEEIKRLQSKVEEQQQKLLQIAEQLKTKREDVKLVLEERLLEVLSRLGMKNAGFGVSVEPLNKPGSMGTEKVHFLFNANKAGELKPLSRVASGGERSRLMLAIKSCITERSVLPTLILDEIDSGVSGEIASKVGELMGEMGKKIQLVAITHLPQIAAKGKTHYLVYKESNNHDTFTRVKAIEGPERVKEIAGMFSGERIGTAAENAARDLLGQPTN